MRRQYAEAKGIRGQTYICQSMLYCSHWSREMLHIYTQIPQKGNRVGQGKFCLMYTSTEHQNSYLHIRYPEKLYGGKKKTTCLSSFNLMFTKIIWLNKLLSFFNTTLINLFHSRITDLQTLPQETRERKITMTWPSSRFGDYC